MDAKLFRLPTKPNFYNAIAAAAPYDPAFEGRRQQLPAPDNRFAGWAAKMADGRLVTDYQNHCSVNVPAGRQFATKEWMTKHAWEIITLSRQRQAQNTGAVYGVDASVVPPPVSVVECGPGECRVRATDAPGGIGTDRAMGEVPELFGTWSAEGVRRPGGAAVATTQYYMGGRNTPSTYRAAHPELR